jgi:hypothetical protein
MYKFDRDVDGDLRFINTESGLFGIFLAYAQPAYRFSVGDVYTHMPPLCSSFCVVCEKLGARQAAATM